MRSELGERADWGYSEELLAVLIEMLDRGQRWWFRAHTKKGSQPPPPVEIWRPSEAATPAAPPPTATPAPGLAELMALGR